ncbi:hypothetical protein JCM5350_005633 [Sporobolomyces pararoseus]
MDYEPAITERQSKFKDRSSSTTTSDHKNLIEFNSVYSFPHSTSIHSFSTTPCCTNLYTGGQDGFIRRYSLYSTLNPSSSSSSPGNGNGNGNLTMKQPPIPSTTTATSTDLGLNRVPFLTGYWENEEYSPESEPATATQETTIKWGTKTSSTGSQSSVYSLAIHSQELWGLSGTSKGPINLFTIRHDQGQIRHVFKPDPSTSSTPRGHLPNSPVSVLTLDSSSETSFLSGGWDGRIFDWDLNTGLVKQSFLNNGSKRQITSITYRPVGIRTNSSNSSLNGVQNGGGGSISTQVVKNGEGGGDTEMDVDADADGEVDADADGEDDDTLLPPTESTSTATTTKLNIEKDPALDIPLLEDDQRSLLEGEGDSNCFMSTSLDGLVLIWDKRVHTFGKGGVCKLEDFGKELVRLGLSSGGGGGEEESTSEVEKGVNGKRKGTGRDKWSTSACWSSDGQEIYVARHSSLFSAYDLRQPTSPVSTYALPRSTGPITAIKSLNSSGSSRRRVLTGSWDCVRVWDLDKVKPFEKGDKRKFYSDTEEQGGGGGVRVVSGGHYGGTLSAIHVDPLEKWMFTTSGTRGWDGNSTENLIVHGIVKN